METLEARQHLSAQQLNGMVVEGYVFNPQIGIPNLTVFADANANSTLDEGESSTISDATGHFHLTTDVDPLRLRVVLPDKYVFRNVGSFQLPDSPLIYFVNLLHIRPITGSVYQDNNNDQKPGAGDTFFTGARIYVDQNSNGRFDDADISALTDADGHYSLETTEQPGSLKMISPAGWIPNDTGGFLNTGVVRNFRIAPAPSISGTISNDLNLSGARDSGENGVAEILVFLDSNGNGVLDDGESSTLTDADGAYSFPAATSGNVKISADGWSVIRPSASVYIEPDHAYQFNIPIYQSTTVSGVVYQDLNRNGARDDDEPPVANALVSGPLGYVASPRNIFTAYDDGSFVWIDGHCLGLCPIPLGGGVVDGPIRQISAQTAADGSFTLHDMPITSLTVLLESKKFVRTSDTAVNDEIGVLPIRPFGYGVAEIHGRIFDDVNNNGVLDDGEKTLSGVFIGAGERHTPGDFGYYAQSGDTTDANGNFTLAGLRQGTFALKIMGGPLPMDSEIIDVTLAALDVKSVDIPVHPYCVMHGTIVELWGNKVSDPLTVYLDQNNNRALDEGELSTESFYGDYYFRRVPEGPYTVRIANSNIIINSTLPSGVAKHDQNIENAPIEIEFTVTVQVYYDANGNGRKDAFEPYLDKVSVFVDANDNKREDANESRRVKTRNGKAPISVHLGRTRVVLRSLSKFRKKEFARTLTINIVDAPKPQRLLIGLKPQR